MERKCNTRAMQQQQRFCAKQTAVSVAPPTENDMTLQQSIRCTDLSQLIEVVTALVKQGLTFEANAETLVIELTGGY